MLPAPCKIVKMAGVYDGPNLVPVRIVEVKNGGEFVSMPLIGGYQDDAYSVFLADLNNFLNDYSYHGKVPSYQHFKRGEIVGVYCKAQKDDTEKLWYRGRILTKFKNVNGITVKVLLVDCGLTTFVPGTLMRKLEQKYQDFPIQLMTCHLHGLKPLTYNATYESLVTKQVSKKWDSSAKSRMQELVEDAITRISVHRIDNDGVFHVTLHITKFDSDGRQHDMNVNEVLVKEDYAIFEEPGELQDRTTADDDAASTASDSSMQDMETFQQTLSPEEIERLMARKKVEEERFNLGISCHMDQYRDVFGLPALESVDTAKEKDSSSNANKSKSTGLKMMPASCGDGVDLADDQSHVDNDILSKPKRAATEKLINVLMGIDPPSSADSNPRAAKYAVAGPQVSDVQVKGREADKKTSAVPLLKEIEPSLSSPPVIKKTHWSHIKNQENEVQSSSLSESEIENHGGRKGSKITNGNGYSSDSSQADDFRSEVVQGGRMNKKSIEIAANKRLRYEKECLKQQRKDRGDENSFRTVDGSWQLLKTLGIGDAMKTKWKSGNEFSDTRADSLPTIYNDVLVSGDNKPKCVLSVEELNIPDEMKYCLRSGSTNKLITKPTPLQSYVWPAVVRGRHVVGIDSANSGKTLAYLLPILKQIVDTPLIYKNLPKGTGPIVLILTTDWNEAGNICKLSEKILYPHRTKYRSKVLYGGRGKIQEEMVSLINGCEVLVSTIPSLLNMIEKRCTNLERLCHLVFDSAHILVESFAEDIKVLLRIYADNLSKTIALNLPHQMIAMSSEWSRGLESLLNAYFDNPLIVIPNKLEASVFKQVKQHVEICASGERMEHVMNFLRGDFSNHHVVICVNSAKDADNVAGLLESQCVGVLKITEFMSPTELKDVQTNWNYIVGSRKPGECILVMTDRAAPRVSIRNATCIINYEFPMKKSDFGERLSCLLGAMKDKDEKAKEVVSVVLLTEQCETVAPSFARLLKRARQHVPPFLNSISRKVERQKEEKAKSSKICEDLKYFGTCRDFQKCAQRHTFFADSDEPKHIPKCGVVKVKILDVISANVFWGKIMEHKLPFGADKNEAYDTKAFFKLAYDMQVFYAIKSNRKRHGLTPEGVLKGDICVIKAEDGFQRVKVKSIEKRDAQTAIATEVCVLGLDNGISQRITVEDLYVLPEDKNFSLQNVPHQAIELIVCGVKPVDKSFSWTVEACVKIDKLISGKKFEGKIVLGLRNTLWLDPLVMKTKYDELNANVTTLHVGAHLLEYGFAVKSNSHVKTLRDLCKDCLPSVVNAVEVVSECSTKNEPTAAVNRSFETVEMPESDYQDVYVSAVENPGLFFVQLWRNVSMLDKLEEKIDAVMKILPKHEEPNLSAIGRGTMCLAKFTTDDKWYRARILEVNEDSEFRVFYVDHGDIEWVPEKRIWKAWPEVLELPCQAIECSLVHISQKGHEWNSEEGDCLWDLCENKLLVAQVKSKHGSDYAGAYRYNIELYDTTGESTINMSHELVFLGHAHGSQDCIQEIFPDALWCPENRECTNDVDCVPDLCLQIYRCEIAFERIKQVKKLLGIVANAQGDEPTITAGARSVVKLMALCGNEDVKNILVDVVSCFMQKNKSLSEEIRREGGLKTLCNMLTKKPHGSCTGQIISALKFFTRNVKSKQALSSYGCIEAICEILNGSNDEEAACLCMEILSEICKGADSNCERVLENDGMAKMIYLANNSSNVKVMDLCSLSFLVLAKFFRVRDNFLEAGVIDAIGRLLTTAKDKMCLTNCLETLKLAISNHHALRERVRKLGLVPAIERILYRPMPEGIEVKRLCKEVLTKLKVNSELTGSGQQIIEVPKLETGDEPPPLLLTDELPCLSPMTLWSQRKGSITIAVQLRGVQNETVVIGQKKTFFSCCTNESKYRLEFELFDQIIPELSNWQVHGGEVLINLAKLKDGVWPRLLSSSIKPPFLNVDFNRWTVDAEEDEHVKKPSSLPSRKSDSQSTNGASYGVPDMYYSDVDSSDDEESSSSDLCDEYGLIT